MGAEGTGWQPPGRDWTGAACRCCQKPMRPANTLLAQWPGTVQHVGGGQCYTCRRKANQVESTTQAMRNSVASWLRSMGRTVAPDHFTWPDDHELAA